jgi:hypothetical protein
VNASNPQVGNEPGAIVTGDFNGDGNLDLAVGVNESTQTVSILLGDGKGNFTEVTNSPITALGEPVLVQDFNGDGIPDLLISDQFNGSITILLGNGDGTFKVAPGSPISTNYGANPVVAADFNRDGIPDLAVAGGYYLTVWLGKGDGSFTEVPISSSSISEAIFGSMAVGDLNSDGIPDLLASDLFGDYVWIYLGNGDGTFTQAPGSPLNTSGSSSLAIGDFNVDGKQDLAIPFYGGSRTVSILLGKGDGTFVNGPTIPITLGYIPFLTAVGDFNGDGIADLFLGAQVNGTTLNILLGNGDGTFSQMSTGSAQLPCCSSTVLGDYNGDGVTDIASSSFYYSTVELLLTQLNETATATATGIAPIGTGSHEVDASYPGDSIYGSSVSSTIGLTATGFAVSGAAVIVAPGATTGNTSTVTLTPSGNFTGSVALSANITSSPNGAQFPPTLSFGSTSPVSITSASAATATLTISTTAATSVALAHPMRPGVPWYAAGSAALACVLLFGVPARRRRWRAMLGMLALLAVLASGVLACGSGGGGGGNSGTTAGTYTITVTGTSGSTTGTGTVTLTVQ